MTINTEQYLKLSDENRDKIVSIAKQINDMAEESIDAYVVEALSDISFILNEVFGTDL